ncbi:MAG: F-box protein [Proteobacteria bacterium]|nr:F-box protein [Pseudomonadota bacterium]
MFKKNFLKSVALMGVSLLASVCANATDSKGLMDVEDTQTFTRVIEDGDPMSEDAQLTTIAALPNEVLDHIFHFLDARSVVRAGQVCKIWEDVATDQIGPISSLYAYFFEPAINTTPKQMSGNDIKEALSFYINKKGFVPLDVFNCPELYPEGAHYLHYTDLESHPDTISDWYKALFGKEPPQDIDTLGLVMSALPCILVEQQVSEKTLDGITSYVTRTNHASYFLHFAGDENIEELDAFKETPHTFVVRADDLRARKDALNTLLETHNDHHVIVALGGEAFIQDGVLSMSKNDIPESLHHLTLADPFGQVSAIGNSFLMDNEGLTSFYSKDFTSLTSIGTEFLVDCKNLTSFGTRGLTSLEKIGAYFLMNCTNLPYLDTQNFWNPQDIDTAFLWGTTNLTVFDTENLAGVRSVGPDFLGKSGLSEEEQEKVGAFLTRVRQASAA